MININEWNSIEFETVQDYILSGLHQSIIVYIGR